MVRLVPLVAALLLAASASCAPVGPMVGEVFNITVADFSFETQVSAASQDARDWALSRRCPDGTETASSPRLQQEGGVPACLTAPR